MRRTFFCFVPLLLAASAVVADDGAHDAKAAHAG